MGNFVASRGTNLLLIVLLARLLLNVDCVVGKSFERETEATVSLQLKVRYFCSFSTFLSVSN